MGGYTFLDKYATMQASIQRMLDVGVPQFESAGQELVLLIITILFVIFFARMMLGAHTSAGSNSASDLVTMTVRCVTAYTVVRGYRTPIPGLGYSVVGLIDAQTHAWMVTFGVQTTATVYTSINDLWLKVVPPSGGMFSFLPSLVYFTGLILVIVAKCLVMFATMYGFIGQALVRLFGAVMLAFILVPRFNQLSWNWIWLYIHYSMLPVVGMAYLFLMTGFLGKAVLTIRPGLTEFEYYTQVSEIMVILLIFVGGIPLIRQVCSGLTGGTSAAPGFHYNPFR
jgi:hypothetical protein